MRSNGVLEQWSNDFSEPNTPDHFQYSNHPFFIPAILASTSNKIAKSLSASPIAAGGREHLIRYRSGRQRHIEPAAHFQGEQ